MGNIARGCVAGSNCSRLGINTHDGNSGKLLLSRKNRGNQSALANFPGQAELDTVLQ
jgi:hypothetical protein